MFIGHESEDGREQTLFEHLKNTAEIAREFADQFHCGDWGYACGLMHDIGKYSAEFQRRIKGENLRVDHSTAGAVEMKNNGRLPAAYCIAGHHSGLPDGGHMADDSSNPTLQGRLKKRIPEYQAFHEEIELVHLDPPPLQVLDKKEGIFGVSFFIRMIYSCLVDADFLDTEQFMRNLKRTYQYESMEELWKRLTKKIDPWLDCKEQGTINAHRTEILKACIEKGQEEQGIYHLTVPTGGGKTVASMAFGIQHALKHDLQRIIYVIPYTSIIEQNAKVFADILGESQVLENHSNVEYGDSDELELKQLAAENWDAPVIVTTNVQFFESLFSNKSSKCRKLHNIAKSVLIFDEAQMFPEDYLMPCVRAVNELVLNYGCTAVMCTATQPALEKMLPAALLRGEICPDVERQYTFFRRTELIKEGAWTKEELVNRLQKDKQALCILNTREQVQEIYEALGEREGLYHLSTYMYPLHRREKMKEIRECLRRNQPCCVIATSLVEAGVDLDFQTVYRELAGVDSVLQAAGRCNREGKRSVTESKTHIFQFVQEERRQSVTSKQAVAVSDQILREYEDIGSLEAIREYFDRLYYVKGKGLDKKNILDILNRANPGEIPFQWVSKEFKMIENAGKTILISCTAEAKDLERQLRYGDRTRQLMRKIGQYSINIYENVYENLRGAGMLEEIDETIAVLRDMNQYSEDIGLKVNVGRGAGVFL